LPFVLSALIKQNKIIVIDTHHVIYNTPPPTLAFTLVKLVEVIVKDGAPPIFIIPPSVPPHVASFTVTFKTDTLGPMETDTVVLLMYISAPFEAKKTKTFSTAILPDIANFVALPPLLGAFKRTPVPLLVEIVDMDAGPVYAISAHVDVKFTIPPLVNERLE
jgi:hypothetical protein